MVNLLTRYSTVSQDNDYRQAPFIVKDIEQLMPTCLVFQDIHCKPFPGNHGDRSNNGHIPSIISITAQVVISQSKVALQNTSLFFKWLNKASYPPRLASVWRQYCRFGLVPPDTRPSGLARELANLISLSTKNNLDATTWSWIGSCYYCKTLLTQIEMMVHIMSKMGGWAWRCGGEDAILFSLSPTHSVPTAHILKHTCSIHSSEIRDSVPILGFWSYSHTVLGKCDGMFFFHTHFHQNGLSPLPTTPPTPLPT